METKTFKVIKRGICRNVLAYDKESEVLFAVSFNESIDFKKGKYTLMVLDEYSCKEIDFAKYDYYQSKVHFEQGIAIDKEDMFEEKSKEDIINNLPFVGVVTRVDDNGRVYSWIYNNGRPERYYHDEHAKLIVNGKIKMYDTDVPKTYDSAESVLVWNDYKEIDKKSGETKVVKGKQSMLKLEDDQKALYDEFIAAYNKCKSIGIDFLFDSYEGNHVLAYNSRHASITWDGSLGERLEDPYSGFESFSMRQCDAEDCFIYIKQ